MEKHKHYQAIRAFADGWEIEKSVNGINWYHQQAPEFCLHRFYRIVPDSEGWIPWYAHESSECPVDGDQLVEVDDEVGDVFIAKARNCGWADKYENDIYTVRYRIIDEAEKLCSICGKGPYDSEGVFVGTGTGDGNSFAHKSCYVAAKGELLNPEVDPYAEPTDKLEKVKSLLLEAQKILES